MVRLGRRGVVRLTRGRGCVLVIKGRDPSVCLTKPVMGETLH